MSKKRKKGKVIKMPLSPTNYIRQRARKLPVYECLINTDWFDSGIATINVARRHANGNITLGFYLIDTFCLGVSDTFFKFNISEISYQEFKDEISQEFDIKLCEYELVHNIIYGVIEFAEDYGFSPHHDFNTTKYILEEDDEKIELIDIEFGRNGKPFLITNPEDDFKREIAILEKTAGPGNYFVADVDELDDFDDDYDEDYEEGFTDDDMRELIEQGVKNIKEINKWKQKDWEEFAGGKKDFDIYSVNFLTKTNYFNLLDDDDIDDMYDEMADCFEVEATDEWLPEVLGVESIFGLEPVVDYLEKEFDYTRKKEFETAIKEISSLIQQFPKVPILYAKLYSLNLIAGNFDDAAADDDDDELRSDISKNYPDFSLSKYMYMQNLIDKERYSEMSEFMDNKWSITEFLPDRKVFHSTEIFVFYHILLIYYVKTDEILKAQVLYDMIVDYGLKDYVSNVLLMELVKKMNEFTLENSYGEIDE